MRNGFFIASLEGAKTCESGSNYRLSRIGVFNTREAVLSNIERHPSLEEKVLFVVEVNVPIASVIKNINSEKFSFRCKSGALIKKKQSIKEFLNACVSVGIGKLFSFS